MRFNILFITLVFVSVLISTGCGSEEKPKNNANVPASNSNSNSNSDNPLSTTKAPEAATANEAPTFTPIVKAYCEALIKRDDTSLRKVFSQDTLKIFEADMKDEKVSSLAEFLYGLEPLKDASKCGARNETITGDKGIAEIRNEKTSGIKIEFVKENGEWKLTNKSPDFESVKESATNSNSGK